MGGGLESRCVGRVYGADGAARPVGTKFSAPVFAESWGAPSLLCSEYRVPFLRIKGLKRGVGHPRPNSAEVTERVEVHPYYPLGLRGLSMG